ncbi:LONGIFOLIA 1-like protein [Drosera capensis]
MSTTATGMMTYHQQQQEKRMEKNTMGGCMANFFSLSNILSPRRLYPKRLSSSPAGYDSSSEAVSSIGSPAHSTEFPKPPQQPKPSPPETKTPSPKTHVHTKTYSAAITPQKSNPALSGFQLKEGVRSPWKFAREAPRLSLDSRFVVDAKGRLHPKEIRQCTASPVSGDETRRSPSVIARLMGLEPPSGGSPPEKRVELRRSASESRSRDLIHYQFIDSNYSTVSNSAARECNDFDQNRVANRSNANTGKLNRPEYKHGAETLKQERLQDRRPPTQQQRKIVYDAADFFPEPKRTASIYGESERNLRARGVVDQSPLSRDLETLNQILETIQLKGLLHSKPSEKIARQRNFVYDDRRLPGDSPIVVMKPGRPPAAMRTANASPNPRFGSKGATRRNVNLGGETSPGSTPRPRFPRNENRISMPEATRRKPAMSVETRRREMGNEAVERRRGSPAQSPRTASRRSDQMATSRSPRRGRSTAEICRGEKPTVAMEMDELSAVSDSSCSACSHADAERWKMEEYGEGRSLLERCDRLLNSIAEMTATGKTAAITELQPSPVSVLDSSFNIEDDDFPSPVMKRTIDFKEVDHATELEDESWSPVSSVVHPIETDDSEFAYIAKVLRASEYFPEDTDHLLLEKQQLLMGKDTSESSRIQRRLIFDTITEIFDRKQQLVPVKLNPLSIDSVPGKPSLSQIWSKLRRIQEPGSSDDLFDTICVVLKLDLAKDSKAGWSDWSVEISDMVFDIERLIFKDLIGETIKDLAALVGKNVVPRRKLVF